MALGGTVKLNLDTGLVPQLGRPLTVSVVRATSVSMVQQHSIGRGQQLHHTDPGLDQSRYALRNLVHGGRVQCKRHRRVLRRH